MNMPERTQIRDAEIRIFNQEPDTDDASDMYVIDALGVTVRIRLITEGEDGPGEPYITVEADGRFTVSVNEDPHTYND